MKHSPVNSIRSPFRWRHGSLFLSLFLGLVPSSCRLSPSSSAATTLQDVSEAPLHFQAKRLQFSGTPRPEWTGVHSWQPSAGVSGSTSRAPHPFSWVHVVPVVPDPWDQTQPVPLWISPSSRSEDVSAWKSSLNQVVDGIEGRVHDYAGREPGFRKESAWQIAVREAERKFGIQSHPQAPVVGWDPPAD